MTGYRWWGGAAAGSLVLCWGVLCTPTAADALDDYGAPPAGSVKITRDQFGVPHIVARDNWSLMYGAGYAQASDQLQPLYVNLLRGQGRAAEQEGFGQLIFDHLMRLLEIPRRSREAYAALTEAERQHLDGFCAGYNAYLAAHRQAAPDWVQPIAGHEVVGFAMYVDTMFCVSHCRDDLQRAGIKLAGLEASTLAAASTWGSNQFAIAPWRSATGSALLSMDPHLPHNGFFRWYEMHLVGPGLNVMGACFYGSPYVSMGRTPHSAWCMTVNAPDLGDVFEFELKPDDPTQYRDIDGWKPLSTSEEVYRVRGPTKTTEMKRTCRRTALGPVVIERDGKAYVFALPVAEGAARISQLDRMARAQNVGEFRSALGTLGLPMFNIVYADRAGDIFYISNGRVPKRDQRLSSFALRPGHETWARWQGYHTLDELPQLSNPSCGYLLNTNSGPHNVAPDEAPKHEDFPAYIMGQQANSRWRRLNALLEGDREIDWEEILVYATDTQVEAGVQHAAQVATVLREAASDAGDDEERLQAAADVLERWDRRSDLSSRGAALFCTLWTDDEFVAAVEANDHPAVRRRLLALAQSLETTLGSLDAPWEAYQRVEYGNHAQGVAGLGIAKTASGRTTIGAALRPSTGQLRDGRRYLVGGSSYGMIVDFSGATQAVSCLPYGVSADPASPHFADQLPLYAAGQFKPAWFWPEEIAAHRESEEVLPAPGKP